MVKTASTGRVRKTATKKSSPSMDHDFIDRLARIETKLDQLAESHKANANRHDDLDDRITAIETKMNRIGGALVAVNFLVLFLSDKIKAIFN